MGRYVSISKCGRSGLQETRPEICIVPPMPSTAAEARFQPLVHRIFPETSEMA